ncbi:MAG: putative transporter permease protein [Actinomycetia bacterium]|jgi:iron(III) transport system permease protein|nr:putative transporter permease protein [Actinomycetes bacterium]
MTTTAHETITPRRGRSWPTAGALQWLTWAVVVALVLGPFLPLLYASFRDRPLYEAGGMLTADPYRQLFSDTEFWHAAWNTLQYAALSTIMAVVAGAAVAILVARTDMPGRNFFGRLTLLPLLLPSLGVVLGWIVVWGPGGYLTNLFSQRLHIGSLAIDTIPGMALIEAARLLPVAFMTCEASLARADSSLEDAARSAGASPLRVLRKVTIPMLRPALLNSGTLIFTLAIASLGIPLLLGTPRNIKFLSSYLYLTWTNAANPDPGSVSAGAMLLLVVATGLLLLRNRMLGAEARYVSVAGRAGRTALLSLRRWRWPLAAAVSLYLLFSTLIPVLGLALMSVVVVLTPLIAPWHMLTWDHWRMLGQGEFLRSIEHSALLALVGAIVTTALVALATLVAHRSRFPLRKTLPVVILYPRAIPGLIIGIGFFWTFLVTGALGDFFRQSIWGIMLAFCIRNLPFAYVVMYPTLARIGEELDRAGRSVGASWWRTCRSIVLPLLRPALFASFILMFVEILNDYDPALFLVKPGNEVIGTTMLSSFIQGMVGPVAALAMVQVAVTVVVLAIGARLFKIGVAGGHDA